MGKITKLISLVLCIVLFAAIALGSGSNSGSSSAEKVGEVSDSSSDTDSASEKASASVTEEKNSEKETAKEEKTEFYVGESFENDGLTVTYVSSCYYTSDNQFITPADGNRYIRLQFHVDNQSGSDKSVTSFDFTCYADGYDASQTWFDDDLSASLSNGRSADGAIYFEVPEGATEIEIEYEYNIFSDKKVKFIFEGDKDSGLVFEKDTSASSEAFHVGDIIETDDLKITYLKAAEYTSDNMFLQPEDGMKYIYIELEFENLSSSDQNVSYFYFDCYADGAACDGFYGMDDALSADISSGRKAKGTVAFEVPVDASVIEIEFEDNLWTDSKIIFAFR